VKKNMLTLRAILDKVKKELTKKEKTREALYDDMRKVTNFSKQSILRFHQNKLEEARGLLEEAKELILKLQKMAEEYPGIVYGGMLSAALQEYSEAAVFLTLASESRFVSPEELNVPSVDYVLGLADVIGEYRRLALDALRVGDAEKGDVCLRIMDEIYIELTALDEAYMLVPGLRRKCDVARRIIEATRGDVTQEVRRKSLEDYLKRFERVQGKQQKVQKNRK
jgi:translin